MFGKKGQVATEYVIITGFVLLVATLIFAYSYVSNDQNIKISQANNSLDKMLNKADLVYAFGPDNNQIVEVTFPRDIKSVRDITICQNGFQQHYDPGQASCEGFDGVKAGAIEIQFSLIGGISTIRGPAKAEIELDGFWDENPAKRRDVNAIEGMHRIKVFWCGQKICLERV